MKILTLLAAVTLAACASDEPNFKVNSICPDSLVQKRAQEARSSDIEVVGQWRSIESSLVPELGVVIGTIKVSKSIRGNLGQDAMVGVVTGDILDPKGNILQCALKAPPSDVEQVFYVSRGDRSLQVIDYHPSSESK